MTIRFISKYDVNRTVPKFRKVRPPMLHRSSAAYQRGGYDDSNLYKILFILTVR